MEAFLENPLLCINLDQAETLRHKLGEFDLAILYGQLKFQLGKSKLTKNGLKEIARSRNQLAKLFGKGVTVTMEKLRLLITAGAVNKRVGLWKGKKRMFISLNDENYNLGLDARKLEMLNKYTGSLEKSLTLAWIAYWIEKRPYRDTYHGKPYVFSMIARKRLASFLGIHEKTLDRYMQELTDAGFIKYKGQKKKMWNEWQYEVSLNLDFMDKIKADWKEYKAKQKQERENFLLNRNNTDASIRINENSKIENNNTKECEINAPGELVDENGNIILSTKQQNYLSEAIKRTLARCSVLSWSYATLLGHMKYVLQTPKKRNSASNFVHCINRAMLLVREGKWKEPFGYLYYSDEAREAMEALLPANPASRCVVPGGGVLWCDYGENEKRPPLVEILTERERLLHQGLSMEEVNQGLLAKFGEYARPHLLKIRVGDASGQHKKSARIEEMVKLAETDPVIRKALEDMGFV